jgi:hypothetical protein
MILKVVLTLILFTFVLLFPSTVFGEYYVHQNPSWSIEYPGGWNVIEDFEYDAVYFQDGSESSYVGEFGIWKNSISVFYYPDMGVKLSNDEEREFQIEDNRIVCEESRMAVDTFSCYNFRVFHESEPTYTVDGYPIITTIFKYTKDYGAPPGVDYGVGVKNMVATSSYIYVDEDLWEFFTESDVEEFDKNKEKLFQTLNSLRIPALPAAQAVPQVGSSEGGGCLIATATFDSELAPQVQQLREIRDSKLLSTESGSQFMGYFNSFYYSFSPTIADYERENSLFKEMVKVAITPLVSSLSILNYVEMNSESEVLGYGVSLIVLNLGMYFVAPAIVIHKIRKFTC